MTLLGVRPKDSADILLNPGLHYTMDEDDICYYIGFTREEYSKVRESPPSEVRGALWQTCASLALFSMAVAGIDPDRLGEDEEEKNGGEGGGGGNLNGQSNHSCVAAGQSGSPPDEGGFSGMTHLMVPETERERHHGEDIVRVSSFVSQASGTPGSQYRGDEEGAKLVANNTSNSLSVVTAVKRGLKLLRFHSRIDMSAGPVVKVNVTGGAGENHQEPSHLDIAHQDSTYQDTSHQDNAHQDTTHQDRSCTYQTQDLDDPFDEDETPHLEAVTFVVGNEENDVFEMTPYPHANDPLSMEAGQAQRLHYYSSQTKRRSLRKSLSDHTGAELLEEMRSSNVKDKGIMYSSNLSLVNAASQTELDVIDVSARSHSAFLSDAFHKISSWTSAHRPSNAHFGDLAESEEVRVQCVSGVV